MVTTNPIFTTFWGWLKAWGPALLWMAIIFAMSSKSNPPGVGTDWTDFFIKKTAHLLEYAILAGLLWRGWEIATHTTSRLRTALAWRVLFIISWCFLYAMSDEYHQSFVAGRFPSLRDIIIDTTGAAVAVIMLIKTRPIKAKSSVKS